MSRLKRLLRNPFLLFVVLGRLRLLNWLPDALYLRLYFRGRMGKRLDLKNPSTFSEKLQWLKLHDRKPIYTTLVDKYRVKEFVGKAFGDQAVIPVLGVWDKPEQIDFSTLPEQFVLKTNHDSGGVIICRNKATFDDRAAVRFLSARMKRSYYWPSREWPYKDVQRLVFAEEYVANEPLIDSDASTKGMLDYKFYCFNGEPRFLYVSQGLEDHGTARMRFMNIDWSPSSFYRTDYADFETPPAQPKSLAKMLYMAKELALNIPFVRVDLFELGGEPIFSEMTFTPTGGVAPFEPSHWNARLGSWINLNAVGEKMTWASH